MEVLMLAMQAIYPQPVKSKRAGTLSAGLTAIADLSRTSLPDVIIVTQAQPLLPAPNLSGHFDQVFNAVTQAVVRVIEFKFETSLVKAGGVQFMCTPGRPEQAEQPWLISAARQIEELGDLVQGWDDEGALSFAPDTLHSAIKVLVRASEFCGISGIRTRPTIVPLPDGSVRFEWVNHDKELFLTVLQGTVEAQRWHPFNSIQSLNYTQLRPEQIIAELEWLAS
jgi:hypothetical protein